MKTVYILGSGGLAKEIFVLINQIGDIKVRAFVDIESRESLIIGKDEIQVISESEFLAKENPKTVGLVIGVGDPKIINKLTSKFKEFYFPNLIHPSVVIDKDSVSLGKGNIFAAGVIFTTCISVGDFNIFNLSTAVGHDAVIGNCNVINPTVNISGGVHIGNMNLIGVGATILQYKMIGNSNTIGAASLVTKNIEDGLLLVGVPAKNVEMKTEK